MVCGGLWCSGRPNFVKTYLRSQLSDARLSGLAVLSIERDLAEELNFHDVIKDFATRKARKVHT